jgi:molybdenum cofactor guanylyltransferase
MPSLIKPKTRKNRAEKNTRVPRLRNKFFAISPQNQANTEVEVWILAGGLSSRMGRDKARLSMNGLSLIQTIQARLAPLNLKVLRKDAVPRCGPLGGILTVLRRTPARAVIFLACDMPMVTGQLVNRLVNVWISKGKPVFVKTENGHGFPFLLPKSLLPLIERQIAEKNNSINALARISGAISVSPSQESEVLNINTPEDWQAFILTEGKANKSGS